MIICGSPGLQVVRLTFLATSFQFLLQCEAFPGTLGELVARLKAWRATLQATVEAATPGPLRLEQLSRKLLVRLAWDSTPSALQFRSSRKHWNLGLAASASKFASSLPALICCWLLHRDVATHCINVPW